MKQSELSKWLKTVIVFLVIIACTTVFYIGPTIIGWRASLHPEWKFLSILGFGTSIIAIFPIMVAFGFSWVICDEIKKDNSFSMKNSRLLKYIANCLILDSVIFFMSLLMLFFFKYFDFTMIMINVILFFSFMFIAIIMAVLSHLTEKAAIIKSENELTI